MATNPDQTAPPVLRCMPPRRYQVVVRNQTFHLSREQVLTDSPNLFSRAFLDDDDQDRGEGALYLDRNPSLFSLCVDHLSSYDVVPLPAIPGMSGEATLWNLIQDATSYELDGLRTRLLKLVTGRLGRVAVENLTSGSRMQQMLRIMIRGEFPGIAAAVGLAGIAGPAEFVLRDEQIWVGALPNGSLQLTLPPKILALFSSALPTEVVGNPVFLVSQQLFNKPLTFAGHGELTLQDLWDLIRRPEQSVTLAKRLRQCAPGRSYAGGLNERKLLVEELVFAAFVKPATPQGSALAAGVAPPQGDELPPAYEDPYAHTEVQLRYISARFDTVRPVAGHAPEGSS
ncbi:hypothetical protein JCM10213_002238 [Rhodosporidiobolus nylandii]